MDFDFLRGPFDVTGQRRRDALAPDSGWEDVAVTSSAVVLLGGAVSIDEMWFPKEQSFGMSLRLYDSDSQSWSVRWLDGCGLQPPVFGRWQGGSCWLSGPDEYRGRPIWASYSWSDVTDSGARWEQCFSIDDGRTWLANWRMQFVRRNAPVEHPRGTGDFDFLTGNWVVHHRRLVDPVRHALGGASGVAEWEGTHTGRTYFGGAVSVDEIALAEPDQAGLTFRVYDAKSGQWSIYWVNSRVGRLEPPVHGAFRDGVGIFHGREELAGHEVQVRFVWSDITPTSAHWRQAFRVDDRDWDENWEMCFTRPATAVPQ